MGRKPLTNEYVKNFFKERGCTLLSEYVNALSKLKYICKNGHETEIRFNDFQQGQGCRKCSSLKKSHTIEYVRDYFKERGCELISTKYINNSSKLEYICSNGHKTEITFHSFQTGYRCIKCSGCEKLNIEYVRDYFKERGCELISTKYVNARSKLKYICKNGHETEIRFNNFQRGQGCMKCSGSEKLTIEYARDYFKERGCELLSTTYVNNRSKLKYVCKNGHKTETTFGDFQRGYHCRKCSGSEKLTIEYVRDYFKEQGCELLSTTYVNTRSKLKYLCKNNHKVEIVFSSFQRGRRCRKCLNKTEKIVLDFLQEHYKNILSEAKFEWCKGQRHLPFDFLLDDEKVIIELDGRQHFEHIPGWKTDLQQIQERDVYKMKCAIENDYRIIRICQEDVFSNTIEWKSRLEEAISSEQQVIYISKDPELYRSMNELFLS